MCLTTCSGCLIGGVCYAADTRNPSNQCEICAPASSASAWSTNTGASCDDGLFCTVSDVCSAAGVCGGGARSCSDGVSCNGSETCDETADRCAAGTSTCAAGTICNTATDTCLTTCSGCVIGGVCYAPNTINPANQCQICLASSSTVAWTARTGSSCDDGQYCTVGETCSAAAACTGGAARSCGDGVTCNGNETCNESTDRCDAGTTTCASGQVCNTSTNMCVASCGGGLTACSGMCTNTSYDPNNCGGCGTVCASATNATAVCAGGCRLLCNTGFADCDTTSPDCEVNTRTDSANCGRCGQACAVGYVCSNGTCAPPTNYTQTASPATWVDACAAAGHTEHLPNDDDGSFNIASPFGFYTWGVQRAAGTNVQISTNGWVAFPSDFSGAFLQPHYGDNYGRNPNICVVTVGSPGSRRWIIEWRDQLYYPPGSYTGSHVTYELIFNEADQTIDLLFENVIGARSQTMAINNQASGASVGGCPGGATFCTPASGYTTRWTPSP
ncbi:MAG: hypothetical protein IT378_05965, partial [Sandaracinaceae bacterium]|nr:hypothetical protein [Sandaracinaceae bacterium]